MPPRSLITTGANRGIGFWIIVKNFYRMTRLRSSLHLKRTTLRTVLENKKTADPSPGSGNFHFRKRGSSKRVMSGPAHKKTSSTSMELSYTVDEEDDHFDERNE
ncbi:hypothetical protein CRE_05445 [Caenorhabditis remanei]|uniref:Uncharacterized protein n=1 Tax=Caenorhabditis remanei TaxID=31234 RepID=E3M0J7_CAERE|nr:hypothetical protein CRE_05445 [Caenorhabditis remanei]